jgi:hypothetical protein
VNQVIKFPDMRPPKSPAPIPELPPPSQYRLTSPSIIATERLNETKPPSRRRLFLWFGVAVALHAALFLGIWLTPPMRIKWSPSPNDWVQVVSLPPPPVAPVTNKPSAPKAKARAPAHAGAAPPDPPK